MKNYPIEKYNIEIRQNDKYLTAETIASSTYAGKPVRGKAICHIEDTYDEQKGIELAAARCAVKVSEKRQKRAHTMLAEARIKVREAQAWLLKMENYAQDADDELRENELKLKEILDNM